MQHFVNLQGSTHLSHCVFDNLLVFHIALVANQKLVYSLSSVAINLLQPLLDVVEGVHVRHIINHANTVRSSVVGGSDRSESFLPGSIPLESNNHKLTVVQYDYISTKPRNRFTYDLQLDSLSIKFDSADFLCGNNSVNACCWTTMSRCGGITYKVNADRRNVTLRVGVIGKSQQQTRFSNTGVPDKKELEKIIVSARRNQHRLTSETIETETPSSQTKETAFHRCLAGIIKLSTLN